MWFIVQHAQLISKITNVNLLVQSRGNLAFYNPIRVYMTRVTNGDLMELTKAIPTRKAKLLLVKMSTMMMRKASNSRSAPIT